MTSAPSCPSLSVDQFAEKIASLDLHRKLTPPRYASRKILDASPDCCPLCSNPYDDSRPTAARARKIATVLHTFLGGPLVAENLFVCCRSCQQKRASTDLLTLPDLPVHLADQRAIVLQLSANHPVPVSKSATLQDVRQHLASRHAHPRSRVYAAQCDDGTCLLGVSSRYGDRSSKGIAHVLGKMNGVSEKRDRLTVYRFADDQFRAVVWELIEANTLVVGVGRRSKGRDFQDFWWTTSGSLGELRVHRLGGVHVPRKADRKEVGARALRARRQVARERATQELAEAEHALAVAEADLDAWFAARRSATGFPVSVEEGQRLSRVRLAASKRWFTAKDHAATLSSQRA